MTISVCYQGAAATSVGGWSIAPPHCLPAPLAYIGGAIALAYVVFTIFVLAARLSQ
jgi:hypothetical protein